MPTWPLIPGGPAPEQPATPRVRPVASYMTAFRRLVPRWLIEGEGERILFALGTVKQALAESARLRVRARFPSTAPPDALPAIGRDRRMARGLRETDAEYAARLPTWLDAHRTAGNPFRLLAELTTHIGVLMRMRTVDNRGNWYTREADGTESQLLAQGNWNWDDDPAKWSRFWVLLYPPPSLWTVTAEDIGDPGLWGGAIGPSGRRYTIGTTATPAEVSAVRGVVREWKPAGTRCVNIILAFDPDSFDPVDATPGPDGTWGRWGIGDDPRARARLDTARYWDGTS